MNFKAILASIAVATAAVTTTALVAPDAATAKKASHKPFTMKAFQAAQAANKSILIDVYAPWCPTCRKQQPAIAAAQALKANSGLVVFRVDFDKQKNYVRSFRATKQSTLIAYKGKKETGRAVGITSQADISRLIATTR